MTTTAPAYCGSPTPTFECEAVGFCDYHAGRSKSWGQAVDEHPLDCRCSDCAHADAAEADKWDARNMAIGGAA